MKEKTTDKSGPDNEPESEKKFDRFWVVAVVIAAVGWVFLHQTRYRVLYERNYVPFLIFSSGSVVGLWFVYLIRKYVFSMDVHPSNFFSDFVNNAKNIFLSVVLFGSTASWGFYFINEHHASQGSMQYENCAVSKIESQGTGTLSSVDFRFRNQSHSFNNFSLNDDTRKAEKERNYSRYVVKVSYKEGYFSSYIIYDWDFEIE